MQRFLRTATAAACAGACQPRADDAGSGCIRAAARHAGIAGVLSVGVSPVA